MVFDSGRHYLCCRQGLVHDVASPSPWRLLEASEVAQASLTVERSVELGVWQGRPCIALDCAGDAPGLAWQSLRQLPARIDPSFFNLVSRGSQLLGWLRENRFCGGCAAPLDYDPAACSLRCASCRRSLYPRISPCIIVLVSRGDELLLVHGRRHAEGVYSAIAGFVDIAETLEQAVAREVREEAGVEVCNIRYFASQPWPFPDQLMIGFHADYLGGDVVADGVEVLDARWWRSDDLPSLPPVHSLARRLIDAALGRDDSAG